MVVGYGSRIPQGSLPVYSVGDEQEARALLILACPTNRAGQFIAPHLVREQTLENLEAFSDHLDQAHDRLRATQQCRCQAVS